MPANIVRNEEDERLWAEAKTAVAKQYPDAAGDRKWKLVTEVFRRMKAGTGGKPAPPPMAKAMIDEFGAITMPITGRLVFRTKRAA
jgi:hypothetical protein